MKIKGKFIIPIVAIIIAMCTVGTTPGFAGDTQPSTSVVDSYTYVESTREPEIPLEDQLGGYVSSAFGDQMQEAGNAAMEKGGILNKIMTRIRNILNSFVNILERIGAMMGSGSLDLGGSLFG